MSDEARRAHAETLKVFACVEGSTSPREAAKQAADYMLEVLLVAAPVPCAASPADLWQPIETAPKDGTKILVYTVHGEIELTFWFTVETDRYDDVGDGLYRKREETVAEGWNGNCPTHWMPLPSPPRATGEGARDAMDTNHDRKPAHVGDEPVRGNDAASDHRRVQGEVAVSLDPHRLLDVATLALERAQIAKAFLHQSGTDPEAWLDEAIDSMQELCARLRGEATVRVEE